MNDMKEAVLPFRKPALLHHWLVGMRGGEKVFQELAALFPSAPIHTLVARPEKLDPDLQGREIIPSALQKLPGAAANHTRMLPLFPWAARSIRIDEEADFVLCSDAAVIKGAPVPEKAKLVCYCHSPPRYLWDLQQEYAERASNLGLVGRTVFRLVAPRVREFDRLAAQRADVFVANSRFVAERIKRCYGKESAVVHPFVDLENFTPAASDARGDFYLIVSQLVPYKRVDLAIDAFNKSGKRLIIIGEGPEQEALQQQAGRSIEFLGAQSVNVLREHYQRCRALIFPGVEDFGITPLEAMASGRPVIAYSKGGVSESVLARQTGLFFHDQTTQALASAVEEFEGRDWSPSVCRDRSEQFSRRRFRDEMLCVLDGISRST